MIKYEINQRNWEIENYDALFVWVSHNVTFSLFFVLGLYIECRTDPERLSMNDMQSSLHLSYLSPLMLFKQELCNFVYKNLEFRSSAFFYEIQRKKHI